MTNRTSLAVALATLVAALPVTAQEQAAQVASQLANGASLRDSTALQSVDGVLTGRGWDYRATVTAAGLHYTPALGLAAATTQHLALSLADVRRGDTVVLVPAAERPPAVLAGERRVAITHGKMTEHFDVTKDGVELSLRFDAPLPGDGDLVARYRLDTSLLAEPQTGDGLSFVLAGVGGVRIGGVTGIDARGERVRGSLRLLGDHVELRLPAAYVANAAYPLVLDPLVGTQFVGTVVNSNNDTQADVAFDATNNRYLLVYRRALSGSAMEIRGNFVNVGGAPFGAMLAIASAPYAAEPKVANLNQRDTFVIGWLEAPSLFSHTVLNARSVRASDAALSAVLQVDATVLAADVAGDTTTTGDAALFVYSENAGAGNATLQLTRATVGAPGAAPVFASTTQVSAPGTPIPFVAISKSNPSTSPYVMAWVAGTTLFTQVCLRNGSAPGAALPMDPGFNGQFPAAVDVDGDGTNFVIAYEYHHPTSGERDVWVGNEGVDTLGNHFFFGYHEVDVTVGTEQRRPAIAWCGPKHFVLYESQLLPLAGSYDVKGSERSLNGSFCGPTFTLLGLNATLQRSNEIQPAVGSQKSGGSTDDDALFVFTEADDSPPFSSSLIAQRYSALGAGGAITLHGSACGSAGSIGTSGVAAIGNTGFAITLSGAQPAAVPFLLWSLPGGETTCGPCSLSNSISALFVFASGGAASYPFPLPTSFLPFVGITLQTQWVLLGTTSNPCPSFPGLGLSATQRQRFTIGF